MHHFQGFLSIIPRLSAVFITLVMSDLLQDKITNAEKRFEEAHGKGDEALTMLYCNQLVELLEIKNAFQAKQRK